MGQRAGEGARRPGAKEKSTAPAVLAPPAPSRSHRPDGRRLGGRARRPQLADEAEKFSFFRSLPL
ncbi:MAG TPA: hypothetical protein VIL38_04960, partial [Thermaerobacter sp.]